MSDFIPTFEELETSFVAEIDVSPSDCFMPVFGTVLIMRSETEQEDS